MTCKVILTQPALNDLREIAAWIRDNDSLAASRYVYDRIMKTISKLKTLPSRGSVCQELAELGAPGYREIRFKPYRIFYSVEGQTVYVRLITDGRRNLLDLLAKRLLR